MEIPSDVRFCINTLENAGHEAYCVGGCVRDFLLGKTPHDFDLCSDALPDRIEALFSGFPLVLAGKKHGTVGVVMPSGVVEITTYRTEGGYGDHRRPDWVAFVPELRQDLARRDFTVNAMAFSPSRGLQDPFGGAADLKKGILRAVGDPETRFREDALRILRGVRFACQFGLEPEIETEAAMEKCAGLLDGLARERVFEELSRLLPAADADKLVRFAPVLTRAIPELAPMVGFDQRSPHHRYDLYTHTAQVTAGVPGDVTLRWTALLHDLGKIPCFTLDETGRGHFKGHAKVGAALADEVLRRLKAPTALRQRVTLLIELHMTRLMPEKKLLKRYLSRWGEETVMQLLALQRSDMGGKGTDEGDDGYFDRVQVLLEQIRSEGQCLTLRELAVNGNDLKALGLEGRQIGDTLRALLEAVVEERLPNNREALLGEVRQHLPRPEPDRAIDGTEA